MISVLHPWQIVVLALAGWINRQQLDVIEYLKEENRVLREHLKGKRIRFTDDQRRRLAAKAKTLGRKVLRDLETIVTPDTLLAWHRKLIARKYDGTAKRQRGRPRLGGRFAPAAPVAGQAEVRPGARADGQPQRVCDHRGPAVLHR